MPKSEGVSLNEAKIAFETFFVKIENPDRHQQRQGLSELKLFMRSGTVSPRQIVDLMTEDRCKTVRILSKSRTLALREQADAVLDEWLGLQETVFGAISAQVAHLQNSVVETAITTAFADLAGDSRRQVNGLSVLNKLIRSGNPMDRGAVMTGLGDRENFEALTRCASSALPFVKNPATALVDSVNKIFMSVYPHRPDKPEPPFS